MINTITKIKKNNHNQNDLSQFLKRKRIELGIRLEDLSSGICSTSYLSRIENNVVDVGSSYYQALFEKMNINYDELKKERSRNLYHEILQAYFRQNYELIEEIVQHALACNNYVETEIELMVLFYNTVTLKFGEARDIILKLEDLYENFSNTEIIFYLYTCALYSYYINQNKKAYRQILVLTSIQHNDTILESSIYDLAIKVMYSVGQFTLCLKYYYHFEKIAMMPLFNTSLYLNKLLLKTIDADINYDETIESFTKLSEYIDLDNKFNKELYYYTLGKIYYINGRYSDVYESLINNILSARITSLLVGASFHLHDYEINSKIVSKLSKYTYNKYERIYSDFSKYMLMIFDGESDYILFNYLRNILFIETNFYDYFLHQQIEKEFIERAIGSSKYKEGLKYLNRKQNESQHEKLK